MTLSDLLERVSGLVAVEPAAPLTPTWRERVVTSVEYDSRQVTPGALFIALKGQKSDGSTFAQQAIVKGAVAAVGEGPPPPGWHAPWLTVTDARAALAACSAVFFGHPSDDLLVVGITGT